MQRDVASWPALRRLLGWIDHAALALGSVFVALFAGIVVHVVFSRYLFSSTPHWAEELPRLLLVWVTFIGAVSALCRNSHFSAGLLPLLVGRGRVRSALRRLAAIAVFLFLVVLVVNGWKLTVQTWPNHTTALNWPVGLFYLALPVCCGVGLVPAFARIVMGEADDR